MSGTLGILRRDGAPADRRLLCSLVRTFVDYAPDSQNVWVAGAVGLGHALLSTTQESIGERQPACMDGRFWITADARLDARANLEYELACAGRTPRPNAPDSELILHAYAAWGDSCIHHLRGDFAFAIWDAHDSCLFCARDHFGVKPFYYANLDGAFVFSNSLGCLRLFPDISEELNDQAIADFLLFAANYDLGSTAFRDIQRLAPAHSLSVSAERLSIRRYWSPPVDGYIRYRSPDEYIEHFRLLLRAAVGDRIRSDRVGIYLSGGMDSSSLAVAARELQASGEGPAELRAYTFTCESLFPDENGKCAGDVAASCDIPIRFLPMDGLELFDRWDDPKLTWPEPVASPFFAGQFDQSRAVASDCRVALNGEGVDNLMLFKMWPYVRYRLRKREWLPALRDVLRYWSIRPSVWPGIRRRLRAMFQGDPGAQAFPRWIAPELAKRLRLQERLHERVAQFLTSPHPVVPDACASLLLPQWSQYFELESAGVTNCPLEVRYPFLDLRIVDFVLAIPPFPWSYHKTLLREAMWGHLPESIRLRPKTPLPAEPAAEKLRQRDAAWLDQVRWSDQIDRYVDRTALPRFGANVIEGKKEKYARVWMDIRPLCLNFWLQSARGVRYNRYAEVHHG